MRIVHYLTSVDVKAGGVTRAVLDLCAGLAEFGHQVVLMTGEDVDVPADWRLGAGEDVWAHAQGRPAAVTIQVRDLSQEVRRRAGYRLGSDRPTHYVTREGLASARQLIRKADAVHLHGPWASPNVQLAREARKLDVRYVVTAHGMLDDWCLNEHGTRKRVHLALFSRKMLERAVAVHCTAQGEADQSGKLFPRGRALVAPLLVDVGPYRNLPGPEVARRKFEVLARPGFKVLCLSRLNKVKGLDRVLRAAAGLVQTGHEIELVFAGPSDPPEYGDVLRGLAAQLGIAERLHLLGMVSGPEKVSLYQACDLYVMPSIHENFGLSLVESLAAGTPIVTSKGVNIWPELQGSGGAEIVGNEPSDEEAELRVAMSGLLSDPARRASMGAAGRRWALELLDRARIVKQYESMYQGESA